MKTSRESLLPNWLTWTLGLSLVAIIVLVPFHAFFSTWGGSAVGPLWLWKSWKELLLVVVGIVTLVWVLSNGPVRRELFRDRLAQAVLALVGFTLLIAGLHVDQVGSDATGAGLAMNLRYLVVAFLAYVLLRFGGWSWKDASERAKKYLIGVGATLAVLGILQVTVLPHDFLAQFGYNKETTIAPYTLIDENPDARRAFATLRGPNDFGAFLIVPLLLALLVVRSLAWRVPIAGLIIVGLLVSGSRSAMLGALIALVALGLLEYGRAIIRSKRVLLVGSVAAIALISTLLLAMTVPALRLAVFHSSPDDSSLVEGSTEQHWRSTTDGVMRVVENPLGCGVGCAGPASYYGDNPQISENYYVQIAEEVGVVGLALWFVVAGIVVQRLYAARADLFARVLLAGFVGISAIGLWLHVWSDDPLALTWWALAAMAIGYNERKQWTKSKDSLHSRT